MISALGHVFDPAARCVYCRRSWEEHQADPISCTTTFGTCVRCGDGPVYAEFAPYCSHACANGPYRGSAEDRAYRRYNDRVQNARRSERRAAQRRPNCLYCGAHLPSERTRRRKFCDQRCRNSFNNNRRRGAWRSRRSPDWRFDRR